MDLTMLVARSTFWLVVIVAAVVGAGCARPEPALVVPSEDAGAAAEAGGGLAVPMARSVPVSDATQVRETLSHADIEAGARGARVAARERCMAHARAGEVVRVRLTIAGATGAVEDAVPAADQVNLALAGCVARELRAARFRRAQKVRTTAVLAVEF